MPCRIILNKFARIYAAGSQHSLPQKEHLSVSFCACLSLSLSICIFPCLPPFLSFSLNMCVHPAWFHFWAKVRSQELPGTSRVNLDISLISSGFEQDNLMSLGSLTIGNWENSRLTEDLVPWFIRGVPIRTIYVESKRKPDSNNLENEGSWVYITEKLEASAIKWSLVQELSDVTH